MFIIAQMNADGGEAVSCRVDAAYFDHRCFLHCIFPLDASLVSRQQSLLPSNRSFYSVFIPMPFLFGNIRAIIIFLSFLGCSQSFAEPYTPAVGSPERVAIANAVRASVARLGGQFEEDARRGAKFVISVLKIDGPYAFFEGGGQEVNGEMTYGPIDIVAFLAKGNLGWKVLNLQARGDVPDDAEVAQLRASLPPNFPLIIVNKFWRDLLLGARHS
jgi:hypothetical protein